MNQELIAVSYAWWMKLAPLCKKFSRETYLSGYDQEDLMQECYLQIVKCLEKYDEDLGVPFEIYFKIQLYGWRANENRKKRDLVSLNEEVYEKIKEKPDHTVNLEKQVENKLLFEAICTQLADMKAMDRAIITQFYIQDKPLKEIAEVMEIKYKSAEFYKGKSLKALREGLIGLSYDTAR